MNAIDSTTVTFSQVYNDFKGALSGVADALKVGAEHVYQVLVMQQVVNSVTLLVIAVILFVAGGICLRYGLKDMKHEVHRYGETNTEVKESKIALLIIGGVTLSAAIIFTTTEMQSIITGFVNPEYGAIMEIKSFIK